MSELLTNLHDLAKSLHKAGAMDAITMRAMDELCIPKPRKFTKADIRSIRQKTKMSQSVFAAYLGVSPSAVVQWESGAKSPSGPAARLLDVVERKGAEAIA